MISSRVAGKKGSPTRLNPPVLYVVFVQWFTGARWSLLTHERPVYYTQCMLAVCVCEEQCNYYNHGGFREEWVTHERDGTYVAYPRPEHPTTSARTFWHSESTGTRWELFLECVIWIKLVEISNKICCVFVHDLHERARQARHWHVIHCMACHHGALCTALWLITCARSICNINIVGRC